MKKVFHDLSNDEQQDIRKDYRNRCTKEYKYSIHLFILYVILGIISIIGLFIINIDLMLGSIIFTMSFILLIIVLYFLYKSNINFYNYLKRIGYEYDNK